MRAARPTPRCCSNNNRSIRSSWRGVPEAWTCRMQYFSSSISVGTVTWWWPFRFWLCRRGLSRLIRWWIQQTVRTNGTCSVHSIKTMDRLLAGFVDSFSFRIYRMNEQKIVTWAELFQQLLVSASVCAFEDADHLWNVQLEQLLIGDVTRFDGHAPVNQPVFSTPKSIIRFNCFRNFDRIFYLCKMRMKRSGFSL